MRKNLAVITGVMLVLPVSALAADTANWTNWATATTGSFIQGGNTIDVTYTGNRFSTDHSSYFYDHPSSFTNAEVTNTPGINGTILMVGGTDQTNNFHFSQPVVDPLMTVISVGQPNVPVTFNFLNNATFTILSQGAGHWGGGTLVQNGSSFTGREGNGLLQFHGTYSDISFTTPNRENFYGTTVGALGSVAAIPEPSAYAMLLAGLGLIGWVANRATRQRYSGFA